MQSYSACPERYACLSGSTTNDFLPCGSGYYCPAGTPTRTSYPCSAGSFTNRTNLAADSECYPCPLGMYCGGSGSDTPDGPCSPGYYCPLRTAASTDYHCPAGTFSDSTSLYMEAQCEDCPPGYALETVVLTVLLTYLFLSLSSIWRAVCEGRDGADGEVEILQKGKKICRPRRCG